jgi:TonB family protein
MNRLLLSMCLLLLPFNKADGQPQFKGGDAGLNYFISQKLVYPEYSKQNCISGTVQVSFTVDKDGKLYHAKVYKGMGIDLDDEAVRVVRLTSGKWVVPAGYDTALQIVLPIKFNADATRCQTVDKNSISNAIDAYRSRQELVNAVTNYYSNKYLGKADTTKEHLITSLKQQLGLDDEYARDVLQQANAKFKQGDRDGACEDWLFVKNIGSHLADDMLSKNCH